MRYFTILFFSIWIYSASAQNSSTISRPRLVVGIAVDQMRWDFLYRYYDRFGPNGFKRLLNGGISCENMFINYVPSVTAVGHTALYSGAVPALSGITGNEWYDQITGKYVYCVSDSSAEGVGVSSPLEGKRSPKNLLVTTITDELKLATNGQAHVIGVSLKDRAAILPAGHAADGAFWFDDASGKFITSNYYMAQLPDWVMQFNQQNRPEKLVQEGWKTLFPVSTYKASDTDTAMYEGKFAGETSTAFPHQLNEIYKSNKLSFRNSPFGNTITTEFAIAAMKNYSLGKGKATDFLTINFASTDAVGHMFGPNSIEMEDTYLRLDRDLATLFDALDQQVGKGQWLLFLSADHGAPSAIGYNQRFRYPGDFANMKPLLDALNNQLNSEFKAASLVKAFTNTQVNYDLTRIASLHLDFEAVKKSTVQFLVRQPAVLYAVDLDELGESPLPTNIKEMIANGYHYKRSGSVQIILNPGWFESVSRTGTTHGSLYRYDTHIPLIWYGWNIKPGRINREVYITDVAPTLATLLHVQTPSGSSGKVITEVIPAK